MRRFETLDEKEVLRYIGCKSGVACDENTAKQVEKGIKIALDSCAFRGIHVCMEIDILREVGLLNGNDIEAHLEGCEKAILLAVTVGNEIETKIRAAQATDALMPVVLDACASVCIESYADEYCKELAELYGRDGLYLTERFSPGYGDFPIEKQSTLLKLTDATRKIGLCVTQSSILVPRKSVTAVLGMATVPVKGKLAGCKSCAMRGKCEFRKRGEVCNV